MTGGRFLESPTLTYKLQQGTKLFCRIPVTDRHIFVHWHTNNAKQALSWGILIGNYPLIPYPDYLAYWRAGGIWDEGIIAFDKVLPPTLIPRNVAT